MAAVIKPTLSIHRTRFVHLSDSGEERAVETGLRVLLRYPGGSLEDRSFEIVADDSELFTKTPAELLKYAVENGTNEIQDLIEFAEQQIDGIEIGGAAYAWSELAAQGYEFISAPSALKMTR
jgi:hypothetical protein